MRGKFPGYYVPDSETVKLVWASGWIVPDANVLLHFFRHDDTTTDQIREVFHATRDRLWMPYQAALEFQRRRLTVISERRDAYDGIATELSKVSGILASQLGKYNPHPVVDVNAL